MCIDAETDLVWESNTYSNTEIVIPNDATLSIIGDVILDNVILHMGENSEIIVDANASFSITNNSMITVCGEKWKGIDVLAQGSVLFNNSFIYNAEIGIQAFSESSVTVNQGTILYGFRAGIELNENVNVTSLYKIKVEDSYYGINCNDVNQYLNIENFDIGNTTVGIHLNNSSSLIHTGSFGNCLVPVLGNQTSGTMVFNNIIGYNIIGIDIRNSIGVEISDNTIIGGNPGLFGISAVNCGNLTITSSDPINHNQSISASRFGIWTLGTESIINFNDISVLGSGSANSGGIHLGMGDGSQILDNYISCSAVAYGIETVEGISNRIENNEITISSAQNFFRAAAIRSMGSIDEKINQNEIYSTSNSDGILASESSMNTYLCNDIHDAYDAHGILFNSEFHEIKGNEYFNAQSLDFLIRSQIGLQPIPGNNYHGNKYYGGEVRAFGLSTFELGNSEFLVNPVVTFTLPTNPVPGNETWYLIPSSNIETTFTCGGSPGPSWEPFGGSPPAICAYWEEIKSTRTTDYEKFALQVLHILTYENIADGFSLPACITQDSILTQLCGIVELVDASTQIMETIGIANDKQNLITAIEDIKENQQDYRNDYNRYSALNNIESLYTSVKPEINIELHSDSINLESILDDLIDINCSEKLINIWSESYKEYIQFILADSLSTTSQSILIPHAEECSDIYGDAVHLARSLLSSELSNYYGGYDGCRENPANEPRSKIVSNQDLTIYPNPSNGKFVIETYSNLIAAYEIINSNGKLIQRGNIENSKSIILDVQSGIYFVRIVSSSGETWTNKMILIK